MSISSELSNVVVRFIVGGRNRDSVIQVKRTKLAMELVNIFYKQGFISNFWFLDSIIYVRLKYKNRLPLIKEMKMISTPGRRQFWTLQRLSLYYNSNNFGGLYIISTPKGLITSNEALLEGHISGEILLKITLS